MVRFSIACHHPILNPKTLEKRARELELAERLDDERLRMIEKTLADRQALYDYTPKEPQEKQPYKRKTPYVRGPYRPRGTPKDKKEKQERPKSEIKLLEPMLVTFT